MSNSSRNNRVLPYLYMFVVFCMTFYGVYFWHFGPILKYGAMALGIILPIVIGKSFFQTKEFICFVAYLSVIYLNHLSGNVNYSNTRLVILSCCSLFIALSMTHFILKHKIVTLLKTITFATIVVVLWTTIATGIIDSTFPGVVRYATSSINHGEESVSAFVGFYRIGMSNYLLPHGLPMMIPPLVMILRSGTLNKVRRLLCIAMLFSIVALLYFSGATGPLLLGVFVLVLSFIVHPGRMSSNVATIAILGLLIIPILTNDELMLSFLDWLDNLVGGAGHFHGKIMAMQDSITMGDAQGDFGERNEIYKTGIDIIFENPLLGTQETIAGHSIFISIFGALGFIGFFPFAAMLIYHYKYVVNHISYNVRVYYYIGVLAAFLMLMMKGIDCWEIWFMSLAFLPISMVYFSKVSEVSQ